MRLRDLFPDMDIPNRSRIILPNIGLRVLFPDMDIPNRSKISLPNTGFKVLFPHMDIDIHRRSSINRRIGVEVVFYGHPDLFAVHRRLLRLPNFGASGVIEALFGSERLSLGDYINYLTAFEIVNAKNTLLSRGPIPSPCNIFLCPYGSSMIKFVSEVDACGVVYGYTDLEVPEATLVGTDGKFFLVLVQKRSCPCFYVYDLNRDVVETILARLQSSESLDIRTGFLVHKDDYFIVCIYVTNDRSSRAYFYASTDAEKDWTQVETVIPRHLCDYAAVRSRFEMFWVNFDEESAYMSVLVFDVFTEAFTECNVVKEGLADCKSGSIITMQSNNPESEIIDVCLCLVMKNGCLELLAYDDQEHLFIPKFVVEGPKVTPDRILFSAGSGDLICMCGASVWFVSLGERRIKRRSVVPQHLEDAQPVYHCMYPGQPTALHSSVAKLKIKLLE